LDWVGPHQLSLVLQARSRLRLLAAPIGPSEVRRTERWLATARVSLALSALFAVWMYPTRISVLYWLLAAYVLYSTGVMMLLKFHKHSTSAFRAVVHGADLLWPALIYLFPEGRNLFFVFFVFVLAAAAYRWGLWETIGTAAGSLTLLWLESVAQRHYLLAVFDGFLVHRHWPKLGINVSELEPKRLFILSVCLLVMGWILGYLAEQHKLLRAELERASLADELHSGVLGSLHGLEMRLHALADLQDGPTAQELRQIQDILLEEAQKLRELRQRVKPVNVDAKSLRPHLVQIAQRFERETGIQAKFVCDSTVVDIQRSICGVVVSIVQEALANVRKHSCATEVSIHLDRRDSNWQLTIEDNGVGFPYSGCFSQSELKASGRGPLVIMECVDSIGGELTLVSTTGRGSRLEITIPRN
jgi:signal transduction histidine kinase